MSVSLIYTDTRSFYEASSTTLSVDIDSSVAAGDMIVIGYMARSDISAPSGFTKYAENSVGSNSQRHGFFIKLVADGTEGGSSITLTQASSTRIEALTGIFRSAGALSVSQTNIDTSTNYSSPGTSPAVTESEAFLAIGLSTNTYSVSTARDITLSAGSDVEWTQLNTDYWGTSNANRIGWAYALYAGADTTVLAWDYNAGNSVISKSIIVSLLEAAPSGGGIRNPLGGPMALRNPMGRM